VDKHDWQGVLSQVPALAVECALPVPITVQIVCILLKDGALRKKEVKRRLKLMNEAYAKYLMRMHKMYSISIIFLAIKIVHFFKILRTFEI